MNDNLSLLLILGFFSVLLLVTGCVREYSRRSTPQTEIEPAIDTLHGTVIVDKYRWLEDGDSKKVKRWTERQEEYTHSYIDTLEQLKWLESRFNDLWRYDDKGVPSEVINGERLFVKTKKKEDEHWVYNTKKDESAEMMELINPNEWGPHETLEFALPSRTGKYVAYGRSSGGRENPEIEIINVETGEILIDSLRGWRQYANSWLPGDTSFYYSAHPEKGEVPSGEEYYWNSVYRHTLGTLPSEDKKVFYSDSVKELFHSVSVSEDGKYEIYDRGKFYKNEVFFKRVGEDEELKPLATGMDASYDIQVVNDKFIIKTNKNAPMEKVYVADVKNPEKENWKLLIPEKDYKLQSVKPINGHLYVNYLYNAYTKIEIYNLNGEYIRDVRLPGLGTAWVSGKWSKPPIWVSYSSFTTPQRTYKYDFEKDSLILYHKLPIDVDASGYTSEQVWYPSKDGTMISMFLVHRKGLEKKGNTPCLLTGYGGFNVSMRPYFSSMYYVWLEAGGMVAIPNLRGGGEYGKKWHRQGMLENKQTVFDDFISAAEWLIDSNYTNSEKLVISGGSNGGLLVGAALVQRPELFRAVGCNMPLLDMLRYHKFDYANIWKEEYGSAEEAEQFEYLHEYSPYHNVKEGVEYPATLIVGSENDARVDPLHARKMVAELQSKTGGEEPIYLLIRKESGHGGGTTITERIRQRAERMAFLMDKVGLDVPGQ